MCLWKEVVCTLITITFFNKWVYDCRQHTCGFEAIELLCFGEGMHFLGILGGKIGNVENHFAHEFCGHVKKELQRTSVELHNAELK